MVEVKGWWNGGTRKTCVAGMGCCKMWLADLFVCVTDTILPAMVLVPGCVGYEGIASLQ